MLRVKRTGSGISSSAFRGASTFPFVRMSAVLGQPDWFGLIFAFMLMLLTLDYRFDGIDLPRYLLIFAATAGIILTRRWYLYFVVGYCFAYVLLLAVSSIRLAKRWPTQPRCAPHGTAGGVRPVCGRGHGAAASAHGAQNFKL